MAFHYREKIKIVLTILALYIVYAQFYVQNHYPLPKLEMPVPKTIKPLEYLDYIYGDTLYDNETNQLSSTKTKLNRIKEKSMKEQFMSKVDSYLANLDFYREILSHSNPLKLLDYYVKPNPKYYNSIFPKETKFEFLHQNIINEKNYCDMADLYFLFTSVSQNDIIYFTDYKENGHVRTNILPRIGVDSGLNIEVDAAPYHLYPNISLFFTKDEDFHFYHEIGNHFLCFSQIYNHIPGHGALTRIDLFRVLFEKYTNSMSKDLAKKCLSEKVIIPKVYFLEDDKECKEYTKAINKFKEAEKKNPDAKYVNRGTYFWVRKINEKEEEVQFYEVNERVAQHTIAEFKNSSSCAENPYFQKKISKQLVKDPVIVENRRVHIRGFLLIASTNPLIMYYHEGFGTYFSLIDQEKDKASPTFHPSFESVVASHTQRTLDDVVADIKNITGKPFTKEQLNFHLKKFFVNIGLAVKSELLSHSSVFELFGVDFIVDKELNFWFTEIKSSPSYFWKGDESTRTFYQNLVQSSISIALNLRKARLQKARKLIAEFHEKYGNLESIDYSKYRKDFKDSIKNDLDGIETPEGFELIFDDSKYGVAKANDIIPPVCYNQS